MLLGSSAQCRTCMHILRLWKLWKIQSGPSFVFQLRRLLRLRDLDDGVDRDPELLVHPEPWLPERLDHDHGPGVHHQQVRQQWVEGTINPTKHFTIWVPQNPSRGQFYLVQKTRSTGFEALKLQNTWLDHPTDPFTFLEIQKPAHDIHEQNKIFWSPDDFEALELWKSRLGSRIF